MADARLSLLDLKDDALLHMLGFFTHGGGKARFTRVSRRARDVTRGTYRKGWLKWARALSEAQRRWVATLCTAPPVRSGFQEGSMVRYDSEAVLRSAGKSDAVIKRLVEHIWSKLPYSSNIFELPAVFIALGFLTDARINKLLEASLNCMRLNWVVYRANQKCPNENTSLIDPGFSFVALREETISDRYVMMTVINNGDTLQHAFNGGPLEYASEALRDDREVVIAAVKQDLDAINYASPRLRDDRRNIMEAAGHI